MTQKIFRILIVLAVSGLVVSGAQSHAQTTNTTPNPTPNTTQNGSPSTNPPSSTKPNANQQPKPSRPAAAPAGAVPPALQAGITAMLSAKQSLQQAGDKWGGYRIKAIAQIDKALDACGQTQTPGKGEMKSGSTDNATLLQTATTQLTTAQNDFKKATNPWGGKRDQALPFITQALQDLQQAAAVKPK